MFHVHAHFEPNNMKRWEESETSDFSLVPLEKCTLKGQNFVGFLEDQSKQLFLRDPSTLTSAELQRKEGTSLGKVNYLQAMPLSMDPVILVVKTVLEIFNLEC